MKKPNKRYTCYGMCYCDCTPIMFATKFTINNSCNLGTMLKIAFDIILAKTFVFLLFSCSNPCFV